MSPNDEPFRANGRGPQNWRVHGWWQSKRPLFRRYWFRANAGDYGYYNHIPAKEARALLNDDKVWRSYFKFTFERNPWDRQVSAYHFRYRRTDNPPPFSSYLHRKRRAWINNYEIYSIDGDPCADFVGKFESLTADFRKALKEIGLDSDQELPRAKANFRRSQKHYRDYYDDETRKHRRRLVRAGDPPACLRVLARHDHLARAQVHLSQDQEDGRHQHRTGAQPDVRAG